MKFSHVPAWGFGKSKKLEIEKTDPLYNPGPGQYAPKKEVMAQHGVLVQH